MVIAAVPRLPAVSRQIVPSTPDGGDPVDPGEEEDVFITPTAFEASANDLATSRPKTLTSNVTTTLEGAWVELIASTDADYTWVTFMLMNHAVNTAARCQIDIGIGAAAEEIAIIENITYHTRGTNFAPPQAVPFPFVIPAGLFYGTHSRYYFNVYGE